MNNEKARKKEAERTLKRIKGTLNQLEEDERRQIASLSDNEEFQRMKRILESGYSHDQPSFFKRIQLILWHPIFLIIALLLFMVDI